VKAKPLIAAVALFVVLLLVGSGLYVHKSRAIAKAANKPDFEPVESVTVAPVAVSSWQPTTDLVGTVIALRSVSVQNEVDGLVTFVGFESGQIVEPGQVLVRLDDRTDRAELESAQAALAVAEADVGVIEARFRQAQRAFDRQTAAAATNATAEIEVDRARAELEGAAAERLRAAAEVTEARARIAEVQTRLSKRVITAPFRARVGLRSVQVGQFLSPPMGMETTPIATLQEVAEEIYIDFAVPQEFLSQVTVGTRVRGLLDTPDPMTPPRELELRVAAIDAVANNATRNLRVRAITDNRDDLLRPGMYTKIEVPIAPVQQVLVVPVTAVRRASYGDQVFVVGPAPAVPAGGGAGGAAGGAAATDASKGAAVAASAPPMQGPPPMVASQRFVTLGPTIGETVVILNGLAQGELVASSGSFKLRDGAKVAIIDPKDPGAAQGSGPAQESGPAQGPDVSAESAASR
jgi:membrane fusion protein (multidrug efflux system)